MVLPVVYCCNIQTMKLPIYFVGLGEDKDDLQPFSIDFYLDSILPETKEIATEVYYGVWCSIYTT